MKNITYNGADLFNKDFNLYRYEGIRYMASMNNIKKEFNIEFKEKITKALSIAGLKYKKLVTYSPKQYNFEGDSIDLVLQIEDIEKYKNYIIKNRRAIDKALASNVSYDGYMATTVCDVRSEIDNIDNNRGHVFSPDCSIVSFILSIIDFYFNVEEYVICDLRMKENRL